MPIAVPPSIECDGASTWVPECVPSASAVTAKPSIAMLVAGAVATLVALVSNGVWTAVAVLAIVLVVQQLEGNVMQPILVGRTLKIHAAVVLTSVALGGTLFGIVGAFLAVPAVAAFQVITRYIREQLEKPPTAPSAVITDLSPTQEPHSPVNE